MPRVDNELRGGMWSVKLEDMQSRAWRMCGTVVAGFGAAGPEGELDDAGAVGAAAADICMYVTFAWGLPGRGTFAWGW